MIPILNEATEKVQNIKRQLKVLLNELSTAFLLYNRVIKILGGIRVISNQESLNFSPYMGIYDIVVPKDNMLRKINELVDFTFIHEELKTKYCLDNGRNAVPPIRMFKYLLLKSIL